MRRTQSSLVYRLEHLLTNLFIRTILYLTDGLLISGASLIAPIFAIFVERIGGGILEAGIAVAIYSFTAGIGIFIFSRIEDRVRDFRHFVVIGYFVASVGYFLYLFVSSPPLLFVAQFILGIATAIRVPAYDVLLSQSASGHLAVAWGNWNSMAFLVSASGAFVGAIIASIFGFHTLLWLLFLLTFTSFMISLVFLKKHYHQSLLPSTEKATPLESIE